jgi:carnitine O-acetyltransferase
MSLQIFVCRNGDNGMTYEHSPAEAVALMTVTNHVIYCANGGTKHAPPNMNPASGVDPPSRIRFQNLNMVQDSLKQAHNNLNDLTQDLELNPLHFKAFGKSFIKNQKYSPDSFLQMAFQLAFYRLHRVPGGHYESGGLRIFKDGRTDIIRSCSAESVEFAKAMVNEAVGSKARFKAMDKAIKGHSNYAKMVISTAC